MIDDRRLKSKSRERRYIPLRWKARNSDVTIALRCSSKPSECLAHKPADVDVDAIQGGTVAPSLGSKADTACDAFTLPHSNFHGAPCLVTWFSPSDSDPIIQLVRWIRRSFKFENRCMVESRDESLEPYYLPGLSDLTRPW